MGGFYVNLTVRGATQKQLVGYLKYSRRKAFVSSTVNEMTVVFDEECDSQDGTTIERLAEDISRAFTTQVFAALGHDNDVFIYWLFEKGQLIDEYNSLPGYNSEEHRPPEGGEAEVLCAAFRVSRKVDRVKDVLRDQPKSYNAESRHRKLAELLGIPEKYVNEGFRSIEANRFFDEDKNLLRVE